MIDPLGQLLVILGTWSLARFMRPAGRIWLLAVAGAGYVAAYSPVASLCILGTVAEAALLVAILSRLARNAPARKYGMYFVLLNLLFVDFHRQLLGFSVETLAISFSTIRIFITGRQMLASRDAITRGDYSWILAAAFFLPAIMVGPVFSGLSLRDQVREDKPAPAGVREHRLLLQGIILSVLVTAGLQPTIENLRILDEPYRPILALMLFVNLFAGFWGQSLIAESSSRFFGFSIPSNFDQPWKAGDIREFWSRWHRSMAGFVMQYIYLPLSLRGVNGRLATVLSFTFMGLWHRVSTGYLLWGLAHGLLLAFWPAHRLESRVGRLAQRVATWAAVVSLSYIANYAEV